MRKNFSMLGHAQDACNSPNETDSCQDPGALFTSPKWVLETQVFPLSSTDSQTH